jgi:hypothetical protein
MKSHVQNRGNYLRPSRDKGPPEAGSWRALSSLLGYQKGRRHGPDRSQLAHPVRTVDVIEQLSLQHRMNYPPRGIQNRQTYGRIDGNF